MTDTLKSENNNSLIEIAALIQGGNEFSLIAHIAPDGDTIGSALALYAAIKSMGKKAELICTNEVPAIYAFLAGSNAFQRMGTADSFSTVIAIDCADIGRLGDAGPVFHAAETTVNIDHHGSNTFYAKYNAVNPDAAATAEIIFELIMLLGVTVTHEIADCLYAAIMTDTGCFSYSNTTKKTFFIAAELADAGADIVSINRRIYRTVSYAKTKLMGLAISNMELLHGGEIGIAHISVDDISSCGAATEDTEGIIEHVRDIDTVRIAIFIKEADNGAYRISLRSKDDVDVCKIAEAFGGGGHPAASGYTASGCMEDIAREIIQAAIQYLEQNKI